MGDDQGIVPTQAPAQVEELTEPVKRRRSGTRNLVEWTVIGLTALLFAVLVKMFLLQAFYIPSESMHPTLKTNDRVLVNKMSYRLHGVHRGDIVVFESLPSAGSGTRDLIKRVVGLPGETVEARDGKVWIDGRRLEENYLEPSVVTDNMPLTKVPPGHYWVMGDNRPKSRDSRFIGPIPRSAIVGRAFVRVWPVSSLGRL